MDVLNNPWIVILSAVRWKLKIVVKESGEQGWKGQSALESFSDHLMDDHVTMCSGTKLNGSRAPC